MDLKTARNTLGLSQRQFAKLFKLTLYAVVVGEGLNLDLSDLKQVHEFKIKKLLLILGEKSS